MSRPKIIIIVGQTATGKSKLGVTLAQKFKGEVISADSRQVYKYLDIGTGKITKKEMRGIPHYLINVIHPKKVFTVNQYKKLTETKIREIINRGKIPIIVGGTGFYIDTIIKGAIYPEVKPNIKLRKSLEKYSTLRLFNILEKLDKNRAKNIDIKNRVRLIRAIEIAKTLGKVPAISENPPPYDFIKIGIKIDEKVLKNKIEKRVKKMFHDGLLNEIKKLKKIGLSQKRLSEFGFEYNNPNKDQVILNTIQYAKRQNTWFKRDSEIKWFTLGENKKIISFLSKKVSKKLKQHQ